MWAVQQAGRRWHQRNSSVLPDVVIYHTFRILRKIPLSITRQKKGAPRSVQKSKKQNEPELISSKKRLKSTPGKTSAARGMWHKCGCGLGVGGFAERAGERDWTNAHRTVNTTTARAQPLSSDAREVCTNRIDGK